MRQPTSPLTTPTPHPPVTITTIDRPAAAAAAPASAAAGEGDRHHRRHHHRHQHTPTTESQINQHASHERDRRSWGGDSNSSVSSNASSSSHGPQFPASSINPDSKPLCEAAAMSSRGGKTLHLSLKNKSRKATMGVLKSSYTEEGGSSISLPVEAGGAAEEPEDNYQQQQKSKRPSWKFRSLGGGVEKKLSASTSTIPENEEEQQGTGCSP